MSDLAAQAPADVVDWCELTLTQRCNQRCFFCYEDGRSVARDPDIEHVKRLLRDTREHADQAVLCGKEVLLRRDIFEIVRYGTSIGLRVVVFSNGQPLAREGLVDQLVEAGCSSIAVSFHFPDPEAFARGTRTRAKGFERQLQGLRALAVYNRSHPAAMLPVSTETDMLALNAGRLAEMRGTLLEAFDGTPWKMRVASLMPCRVHEIGLEHALAPMLERREEIATFVQSHPADLPLDFVKIPLCLLPPGFEHRSLDVQYLSRGTALTFNHADPDNVEVDTITPSLDRSLRSSMDGHPYRWVCRSCSLAAMCRFQQVDWHHRFFEPTRGLKPEPPRTTAREVLSRLGADSKAIARVEACSAPLAAPYPEEDILRALQSGGRNSTRFVDAYVDGHPLLTVELEALGETVALRLGAPRFDSRLPLGSIIGYLDVHVLAGAAPRPAVEQCLRAIASAQLPGVDDWAGTIGFDAAAAELLLQGWNRFGARLWPGFGAFGAFGTTEVRLTEGGLRLQLASPRADAIVLWRPARGRERESIEFVVPDGAGAANPPRELVQALRQVFGDTKVEARVVRSPAAVAQVSGAAAAVPGKHLVIRARLSTSKEENRFLVGAYAPGVACLRQVGPLALWYGPGALPADAAAFARVLLAAMRALASAPLDEGSLGAWRRVIAQGVERLGPRATWQWHVEWRDGTG